MGISHYVVWQHEGAAELYIDRGDREENEAIFDELSADRGNIEKGFEGPWDWQRLDGKRACRIRTPMVEGGWRDEHVWPTVQDQMLDRMARLETALRPRISKLG